MTGTMVSFVICGWQADGCAAHKKQSGRAGWSFLVEPNAVQCQRNVHESDRCNADESHLELLKLGQVGVWDLKEGARCQQLIEHHSEAEVEEAQRAGEMEAAGEDLLVDQNDRDGAYHIAHCKACSDHGVCHTPWHPCRT